MDKKKDISLQNLAVRVINGEFGNGNLRKERLGYLYPFVQNIVNKKLLCTVEYPIDDALIEDLAKKAMDLVQMMNLKKIWITFILKYKQK